ncbi:MAG: type II toxin-antitoxin system HicB family antitoxin [SAR202 cluster bacterium]|nr:type II toxin-antitoxin system HicB family antitoxin [SAR202 cluster bacterium]
MRFTILGQDYDIDPEDVIKVAEEAAPEPVDARHKFFVSLRNRRYPIKQLLAGATGLRNSKFTAQYAERILPKLGFTVEEFGPPPPRPHFSPKPQSSRGLINGREDIKVKQFAVTLENDEDGFFVSSCPALPGCHSQGRTRDEALNNIAQAIRGYLASMQKHGETIPEANWEVVEVVL